MIQYYRISKQKYLIQKILLSPILHQIDIIEDQQIQYLTINPMYTTSIVRFKEFANSFKTKFFLF